MYKDKIGFLNYPQTINFNKGLISPLDDFDEISTQIKKESNKDGFFYPPTVNTYSQQIEQVGNELKTQYTIIPRTQRPSHLFKISPSHDLEILSPNINDDPKNNDGLFITYLLSFFFGVRLQFHDWFFDGRVPVEIKQGFVFNHSDLENFIETAYNNWCGHSASDRNLLINLLYMYSRVRSYEWDWERFIFAYMVFDGCYRFLNSTAKVSSKGHANRIKTVLNHFSMKVDQQLIDKIVGLRNELFHETLWMGTKPSHKASAEASTLMMNLKSLNTRLLFAILGHTGEYVYTPWWSRDKFGF